MTDGSRYISHDADGGREGTATPGEPAAASVGPMRYRDTRAITDGAGEAAAVETSAAPVTAPPPLSPMARRALRPPPTPRSRRREPTVASGFITNRGGVTSFGPPGTARATGATGHHRTRRSQDQRWGVSGFITFVAKAAG